MSRWKTILRMSAVLVALLLLQGSVSEKPGAWTERRASLAVLAQTSEPSCTDSDGGLAYFVAGYVEGVGANGWPYAKSDVCETGAYEGNLKEFYCVGDSFRAQRHACDNGCLDGACMSEPPGCTDADGDTYAVEGGACGTADCDDTDPSVNPGAVEVCANSIDDDCNGLTDSDDPACLVCTDVDGDGYAIEGGACGAADCNDGDANVNPGTAEICGNGIDDDCDGLTDGEEPACGGSDLNVLVIGWDGVQRDHFWQCYNRELPECADGLPNVQALNRESVWDSTTTSGDTATKPGWAQILTGYNAEVTGVFSNGQYQPIPEGYTVFEKAESQLGTDGIVTIFVSGKGVNTGAACIGEPTTANGLPATEDQGQPWCLTRAHLDYYENDLRQNANVGNRALQLLEQHQDDRFLAFFLFRDPDVTGHLAGEDSAQYSQAVINDDAWLGRILAKLRELRIDERTLVYVTTDHGFDEGLDRHGNAPYAFLASNDPLISRSGDRKDLAPTILERLGIEVGALGSAPAVDGYSLYALPPLACVPEGEAYVDYPGAPTCCSGLDQISLDRTVGLLDLYATGGTGDGSGYCTDCGNGACEGPENRLNCPADCPLY
jgi:hypothetical protein